MIRRYVSPTEFRHVAADSPHDVGVCFVSRGEVQRANAESRVVTFVVSTDEVDRAGDSIDVNGWDFAHYMKNPVVLWAHNNLAPPIGRSVSIRRESGRLLASIEFIPQSIYPFAETIFQMVQNGYLGATSVGFLPTEYRYDPKREGIDYLKHELLEISVVPVPCNASALQTALGGAELTALFDHPRRGSEWSASPVQNAMYQPPPLFGYERETRRALIEHAKASRQDRPAADRRHRELADLKRQIALSDPQRLARRRKLRALKAAILANERT